MTRQSKLVSLHRRVSSCFIGLILVTACGDGERGAPLSDAELRDPEACRSCHPIHYEQWAGSMHAYAATDPVFVAMNQRGQRETKGALGSFCVNCHAPLAVRSGATQDGLNLDGLPKELLGITCSFCHQVDEVLGSHNNALSLADDRVMRGGISQPVSTPAHRSRYSSLHDSTTERSSTLCGACHDVTLTAPLAPAEVALERTFQEWKASVFGQHGSPGFLSCSGCHMQVDYGEVATGTNRERLRHGHDFPAVDLALTPFPDTGDAALDKRVSDGQVSRVAELLDTTVRVEICVQEVVGALSRIRVTLENLSAGHFWPSGATQDRRAWVELKAYRVGEDTPFFQSGTVPEDEPAVAHGDPNMWLLRDRALDAEGNEVHMFWEIAELQDGARLPVKVTTDPVDPDYYRNHVVRWYPRDLDETLAERPDRVTVRLRLRPVGLEIIDDLIESGDLDASIRARMPVFDLLPNRHLVEDPVLADLAANTFEWSELTRQDPGFQFTINAQEGTECIAMPATLR